MDEPRNISFTPAEALPKAERERHERYMAKALALAQTTPGPFGAVIVDRKTDSVVCAGINKFQENRIFHGEIDALNNCARLDPKPDPRDLTLYTSAEPCPMCQSAIVWTGIPETVYGTSIEELVRLGINQIHLDSTTVAAAAPFYSGRIIGGVLREQADVMYRKWDKSSNH